MILYILKVALAQAIGVSFYRLFWYRKHRIGYNRALLLTLLLVSFFTPLLEVELNTPLKFIATEAVASLEHSWQEVSVWNRNMQWNSAASSTNWILMGYASICFLLLLRFIIQLFKIRIYFSKNNLINPEDSLYSTSYPQAFSFFNKIHLPNHLGDDAQKNMILLHEKQHVALGHSWDRMLVGIATVLLWFNPFTFLIRKYLMEVHEFEADARTVDLINEPLVYQLALINQVANVHRVDLINYFSLSNTKRRIKMINQQYKVQHWKYYLFIPVIISPIFLFSFDFKKARYLPVDRFTILSNQNFHDFEAWLQVTQSEIPSILPIQLDGNAAEITSGWGKRIDPFTKEERQHYGIDIKARSGTAVIASAAGKVVKIGYQPNGYGRFVIILHSDDYKTRYAQMKDTSVNEGDEIEQGQLIGHVGSSGRSTAPHLHYEVYKNGNRVNPADYITDFKE